MLYHWYELAHAAMRPARATASAFHKLFNDPLNPLTHTPVGRHAAAACEVFERTTRRYEKPSFGIASVSSGGRDVAVTEEVVWERPFCRMLHFKRDLTPAEREQDPRILLVAPMSGHFATLLRGTVEALLPDHEVYITDWEDARNVPLSAGTFDLGDYMDYVRDMLRTFSGDVHVFGVCQPSVPVLAAVALMEEDGDPGVPRSMILTGGPIDTRINPTAVNNVAEKRGLRWFKNHAISVVPWPNPGAGREVYPGFLQLSGFMSMNLDRHASAHKDLFFDLIRGDGDSAEKHREFYDEYLAVMDLTAEFYLDTVDTIFIRHALPKGQMIHRGRLVDPGKIKSVPLFTSEGEKDDITGLGQCRAAHDLCSALPEANKLHFTCPGVGHYGTFNGSRFRNEIAPRIAQFVRTYDPRAEFIPRSNGSEKRGSKGRVVVYGNEPSSVAFTFAPANDTEPDPADWIVESATEGERRAANEGDAPSPQSAPFQLWALAGNLVIDGVFRFHTASKRASGTDRDGR